MSQPPRAADPPTFRRHRALRDFGVLALVFGVLWLASALVPVFTPTRVDISRRLVNGLRNATAIYLPRLLLLPFAIGVAEACAGENRRRKAALYVLGGFAFAVPVGLLEHQLSGLLQSLLPSRTGARLAVLAPMRAASLAFGGLTHYALILLIKHHLIQGRRLAEKESRASHLESQLLQARLDFLKSQLQPHFLFNALNVIHASIPAEQEVPRRMTLLLSRLLRRSVGTMNLQAMSLKEELGFVDLYLEIERLRFQDRLNVVREIAPDCLARVVPHLILQPLVENALKHGLGRKVGPGTVWIRAWDGGDCLAIAVEDDGLGERARVRPTSGAGLGHRNIRARLQHLFGRADLLEAGPRAEGGYRCLLRIPHGYVGEESAPEQPEKDEP